MSQTHTQAAPVPAADLTSARRKLPLVEVIVRDIVGTKQKLAALTAERETLDSFRRELTWTSRRRRYAVTEEAAQAETVFANAVTELSDLGVSLVDAEAGAVEFPTKVNGQPAAFSWRLGDDGLRYWRLGGDATRHPIPTEWRSAAGTPGRNQR